VGDQRTGTGLTGLPRLPRIDRLHLADLVLPDWHPVPDKTCEVFAYVIHHPDGPILLDTGVGDDNEFVNEVYAPTIHPIDQSLGAIGIDIGEIVAVVNCHLHLDHCGQNPRFYGSDIPVFAQAAELDAAAADPMYTDPTWAAVPDAQLRRIDGDETLAEGVRVLTTPGHTAGHQSIAVESDEGTIVLAGQAAWSAEEFATGEPSSANTDEPMREIARDSLRRLLSLRPRAVYFSHDRTVYGSS